MTLNNNNEYRLKIKSDTIEYFTEILDKKHYIYVYKIKNTLENTSSV